MLLSSGLHDEGLLMIHPRVRGDEDRVKWHSPHIICHSPHLTERTHSITSIKALLTVSILTSHGGYILPNGPHSVSMIPNYDQPVEVPILALLSLILSLKGSHYVNWYFLVRNLCPTSGKIFYNMLGNHSGQENCLFTG